MPAESVTAVASTTAIVSWLGLIAGFTTLAWRISDYFRSFLQIELTAQNTDAGGIKIRTEIKNSNISAKTLHGVFLIVGPADESPAKTFTLLSSMRGKETDFSNYNEMVRAISNGIRKNSMPVTDSHGRGLFPLPYYYQENIGVGDETLSFELILDGGKIPSGSYSVRLYVDALKRYHRVVQAAFDHAT